MTTWILYHIFCLLSTVNFIFLKFFLIVYFSKTIICDSSVIIPLGVMLVNHKIQIFLIILFVWLNLLISIGMEGPLATHVTFPMWTVRGKAISEFRSPNALPRAPTPLGTEGVLRCCMCYVVDFCLYAAVLRMERYADLVSVFFGTYGGTLCRSNPCILRYLWWYAVPIWPCILRYLW